MLTSSTLDVTIIESAFSYEQAAILQLYKMCGCGPVLLRLIDVDVFWLARSTCGCWCACEYTPPAGAAGPLMLAGVANYSSY